MFMMYVLAVAVGFACGCGMRKLQTKYKGCGVKLNTNNYLKYAKII